MRGASGGTGWSLMCSSTRSDARQSARDVDAGVEAEPGERLRHRLARRAVEDERDRIDGAGDQVGAGAGGLDRRGERGAAGALAVEADRQPARLADRLDQLADAVRLERAGRIVDEDARGAELGQALRLGDERVGLAGRPGL